MLHWHSSEATAGLCFVLLLLFIAQDALRHWPYSGLGSKWDTIWFLVSSVVALRYLSGRQRSDRTEWLSFCGDSRDVAVGGSANPGGRRFALVTGATSGIGTEVAAGLLAAGYSLILTGTDAGRLDALARRLRPVDLSRVLLLPGVDLAKFDTVTKAVKAINETHRIDLSLVVHCAATLTRHYRLLRTTSSADHEAMIATNFLGLMLLNELILPNLQNTAEKLRLATAGASNHQKNNFAVPYTSRVVIVGSCAHTYLGIRERRKPLDILMDLHDYRKRGAMKKEDDYSLTSFVGVYGLSKLCAMYYCEALNRRLQAEQASKIHQNGALPSSSVLVEVCCCHPGIICTGLYRDLLPAWIQRGLYYPSLVVAKTCAEGAETVLHCCLSRRVVPGGYYVDCREYGRHADGVYSLSRHALDVEEGSRVVKWGLQQISSHLPR
jgi:NAD(P)-dependent dehydrogenase (short-subunit alcohol dehydrogenase family)